MILRAFISAISAVMFALLITQPVFAHPLDPRVEISRERLHPGEVVDVRGVAFGMDDVVTLTLIGSGIEIPLGDIVANAEGEFLHIVALPTDLAESTYYFRAVTSHHYVISPPLTVWGTAIMEGGGQGLRDEDDGLLAPMPTLAPAVATISVPIEVVPASSGLSTNILILVGLMIVVAVLVFGFMRKKNV